MSWPKLKQLLMEEVGAVAMKALTGVTYENGTMLVTGIHYMQFDEVHGYGKSVEQLESEGIILVDAIPTIENNDKLHKHYINVGTKEQWYEYVELTPSDVNTHGTIAEIKNENALLKQSIADLWEMVLLGGDA